MNSSANINSNSSELTRALREQKGDHAKKVAYIEEKINQIKEQIDYLLSKKK